MKEQYTAMKAEKIDFGAYDMATTGSIPDSCIQIVANHRVGNTCTNPSDTTQLMWVGDNPYGE